MRRWCVVLAFGSAAQLMVAEAAAYCISNTCQVEGDDLDCVPDPVTKCPVGGKQWFFTQHCQSFSVHVAGSSRLGLDYEDATALITEGVSMWNGHECEAGPSSAAATLFPAASCNAVEHNPTSANANVWMFRDEWGELDPTALAVTTSHVHPSTGEVYGADVELNAPMLWRYGRDDLVTVVAHEAGHFFGLGHSNRPVSLMAVRAGPSLAAEPTTDDIAGLCALHPPAPDGGICDPTPKHGFSPLCGPTPEGCGCAIPVRSNDGHALFTAVALAAVGAARRRCRKLVT
jgi:hypothetical protein